MKAVIVGILMAVMAVPQLGAAERQLSVEDDACSGQLSVKDKDGNWISIPRGQWVVIDVKIDHDDYWYWRCGNSEEKSRSGPHVERLKVWHSPNGRDIIWACFEVN